MFLFPIGSCGKLPTNVTLRAMRSNGSNHTNPVVVMPNEDDTESNDRLDISRNNSIFFAQDPNNNP